MCTSRVMFASQVKCASRVKSGAHHITLRQSRKTSLRRKPQHHLRRRRKHHCNRQGQTKEPSPWPSSHGFSRFPSGGFEGRCKVSVFGLLACRWCPIPCYQLLCCASFYAIFHKMRSHFSRNSSDLSFFLLLAL